MFKKMKITEEVLSKYNDLDQRVTDFISNVISELKNQKIPITDYTKLILDMLVAQLILYFKSIDELQQNNLTNSDNYNRTSKSPTIAVMQKANDQILILMDKISLSPLSAAKVNKLREKSSNEQSASDLLDKLIND